MRTYTRMNLARTNLAPMQLVRTGLTAATLLAAVVAGGCVFNDDPGMRPQRLTAASTAPRKRTKVAHLVKARAVIPGSTLRQFCDQRHIRFQAGTLDEKPDEMAHNNDLCKQIYDKAAADAPAIAAMATRTKE